MNNPPATLVKTWYELLVASEDESVKKRAKEMLLGAYGSEEAVVFNLRKLKLIN